MVTIVKHSSFRLIAIMIAAAFVGLTGAPVLTSHLMAQDQEAESEASPVPSADATPVQPSSFQSFIAAADTYVMPDTPNDSYGDDLILVADEDLYSLAYIQFDVTGISQEIVSATLELSVVGGTDQVPELWVAPPVPIDEDGMTWNTRPALNALVEAGEGAALAGDKLEYDVTSAITGNGTYTFALVPVSRDGLDVSSREAAGGVPELVLGLGEGGTAFGAGEDTVLLAVGDIAGCDWETDEATAAIVDEQPGVVAVLGDSVYPNGTEEEFADCYEPTWGRHRHRTFPVPGNHEYRTNGAGPYYEYFGAAAGEEGKGYYSYDLGAWHIVALNTNIDMGPDSEQVQWLIEDLESNPAACTIAYWHYPRFSSGDHGNNRDVGTLYSTIYDYGVEVLLTGHDHDYERYKPLDPSGRPDAAFGVRQFVVGTGGAGLRPFGTLQPSSEVRIADVHGVLRLQLYADSYEWQFLAVEGESFFDSGSGSCHDVPVERPREGRRDRDPVAIWAATDARRQRTGSRGRN